MGAYLETSRGGTSPKHTRGPKKLTNIEIFQEVKHNLVILDYHNIITAGNIKGTKVC